jgi:hypothetical protein
MWLVSDYYTKPFGGSRFDKLAGTSAADLITGEDLAAVRALSIGFPRAFTRSLESSDVQRQIRQRLTAIPSDIVLEDLSGADFGRLLGPHSAAWKAWDDLAARLRNAGARAPLVGASKLLAAKRPLLVPLEDSYVRQALDSSRRDIWQVIYHLLRDPQIREDLTRIRRQAPAASHIPLHRILDVIAWRKHQGHCCSTHIPPQNKAEVVDADHRTHPNSRSI